jgi:hypothetical protein
MASRAAERWQASTAEVRSWALGAGFEPGSDGGIPDHAITVYNQTVTNRQTKSSGISGSSGDRSGSRWSLECRLAGEAAAYVLLAQLGVDLGTLAPLVTSPASRSMRRW